MNVGLAIPALVSTPRVARKPGDLHRACDVQPLHPLMTRILYLQTRTLDFESESYGAAGVARTHKATTPLFIAALAHRVLRRRGVVCKLTSCKTVATPDSPEPLPRGRDLHFQDHWASVCGLQHRAAGRSVPTMTKFWTFGQQRPSRGALWSSTDTPRRGLRKRVDGSGGDSPPPPWRGGCPGWEHSPPPATEAHGREEA
ncbi:hypothetical protein B0H19DRAFT_1385663 [Mycena capillaripes]|nr:hypothetical protein B0H19DRAFT_1385663 [Mycena capillaripes]